MKVLLFDIDEIKHRSLLHSNINDDNLLILCERVQDTYVQYLLGDTLYQALQQRKQDGTLTTIDNTLLDEYLMPCFLIRLEQKAIIDYNIDYRNLTVGTVVDSQIRPLTVDEIRFYVNEKQNELEIIEDVCRNYICSNYGHEGSVVKPKLNNNLRIDVL